MAIAAFAVVGALAVLGLVVAPASAIVHPVTPVGCADNPAQEASGGNAGGFEAFDELSDNPSNGPPMPAQGADHAAVCDG